jgi:hypothetical protein
MKKGDTVRLNDQVCFTTANGGGLRFPLSNSYNDNNGIILGTRITSEAERDAWRKRLSEAIDAGDEVWHDCAGEARMAPRCTTVAMARDHDYVVVRARCSPVLGYHKRKGMTLVRNALPLNEGERCEFYVKRELLEVVS